MNNLVIMDIVEDTVVDGPGFRTAIYAAGCPHKCRGCHNPDSWSKSNGQIVTIEYVLSKIKEAECANVTFSGGEPFEQTDEFAELARRIKQETEKNIWCYTGYEFEQLSGKEEFKPLLDNIDVIIDGRFEEIYKSESIPFRGSLNQRVIDVKRSICDKRTVTLNY